MHRDTQDQAVNTFLDLTPSKITNSFLNRSLINSSNYASCWNITNNPNNPFPWNVFIMLPEYNILTHNIILFPPGCLYLTLQYHFRGLQGSLFTFPWHPDPLLIMFSSCMWGLSPALCGCFLTRLSFWSLSAQSIRKVLLGTQLTQCPCLTQDSLMIHHPIWCWVHTGGRDGQACGFFPANLSKAT